MKVETLERLAEVGRSLDTETYALEAGMAAPPTVCGSKAQFVDGKFVGQLLSKGEALAEFKSHLGNTESVVTGANIAFDSVVLTQQAARLGEDLMPLIHKLYAEGRVYDVLLAEALDAIAGGYHGKDPRTIPARDLVNPETGKKGSYSLAIVLDLVLGRKDAKANDEYRKRYGELDDVPMEHWPDVAKQYPVDDAINTHEIALAQAGHRPKSAFVHNWVNDGGPTRCVDCGQQGFGGTCKTTRPHRNLHDLASQARAAFALALAGAYGFRVDQKRVDLVERHAIMDREAGKAPFVEAGILRDDGGEDQSRLKRLTAIAYGADKACTQCCGTGKVPSPSEKPVRCRTCKGQALVCDDCMGVGKKVYKLINCCRVEFGEPGENGKPTIIKHKTCDGTGYVLSGNIPRTDTGGVGTGRDALYESGDELLMAYAAYCEDDKVLDVYLPYLRGARRCLDCGACGTKKSPHHEGCSGPGYYDVPLTLGYFSLLATGRVSCRGAIQLFPRKPGYIHEVTLEYVYSLRECIVPRCKTEVVEVPDGHVLQEGEQWLP